MPNLKKPIELIASTAVEHPIDISHYQADDLIIDATQHNAATRLAKGAYQNIRRAITTPLIALFILAPWLHINHHPMLQMDLSTRQLHLLGFNFWPDDLLLLTWLALASAFALFAVANFAGRLWCGFTCPQTVWSMMFIWLEEKIEGSRNQRLKQKNTAMTVNGYLKLIVKHMSWLGLSFITGFTFVAFFETGPRLFNGLMNTSLELDVVFWLVFFTALTYINAGWLREQVCLHMCPYARFQSVMLDNKSLKVSYDVNRGEPRKNYKQNTQTTESKTTGDCVDCKLCVQVCPVGIDIRQGMQYACIDCGACIDACDEIMKKINKPTGLIRFSNGQDLHWSTLFKNRKRLTGYITLTLLSVFAFYLSLANMEQFDASLNRDRGQLYFYDPTGNLNNAYTLKIHNKTMETQEYKLSIHSVKKGALHMPLMTEFKVQAGDNKTIELPIRCTAPCDLRPRTAFELHINNQGQPRILEGVFFNGV